MVASAELTKPVGVRRLVYKELLSGDYRKLAGTSNDTPTGGGARDLRFPFAAFDGVFAKLLPGFEVVERKRKGVRQNVKVRSGPVFVDEVDDEGVMVSRSTQMSWENSTDSRSSEGRIPRVHDSDAAKQLLAAGLEMRDVDGRRPRVFALFVQDDNGELRVHYAYEQDLRAGDWADSVARPILEHLDDLHRRRDQSVVGYIDFLVPLHYAHNVK
ncbi:hypothetical protein [Cellulomonas sp.]|uniref:hypothetical protein n=1 Tax=Cellulomonas sp. TaxID=40001 RepID=UPI0025883CF7|nr:hypothetical protein [Cellulomonas sp.]MCR6688904.1 hypothetical protein [Cellulomonas sp.]